MRENWQKFVYLLIVLYPWICTVGCGETFIERPPFTQVQDSIFLDVNDWYYYQPEPVFDGQVPMFPFSFDIFGIKKEGHLLSGTHKIYFLEDEKALREAHVILDTKAEIGDTLYRFSDRHYYLLIDKKKNRNSDDEIFFVLRRSKIGVGTSSLKERTVWAMSIQQGILAVCDFLIDTQTGRVTLDIIGEPYYFQEMDFVDKVKYYDFDRAHLIDSERNLVYTYEKFKGKLKSKNFKKNQELYSYTFKNLRMRELINFRIRYSKNTIELVAEDSCFIFNDMLELLHTKLCE